MTQNWRTRLGEILSPAPRRAGDDDDDFGGDNLGMIAPAPSPLDGARQAEAVLIVDDDTDWACECAFSLEVLGYEPIVALSASDALALFHERDIPIAIIDYELPEQDGLSLIEALAECADEQGRHIHFIMATGHASKDLAIGAMRASATDFLEKPVNLADLRRALQRIEGLRDTPAAREQLLGRITSLSGELQRIARLIDDSDRLAASAPSSPAASAPASEAPAEPPPKTEFTAFIRDLLRKETKRRDIGGGELFGDPTWAMLLDLLLARIEDQRVSVSSACIASGAPMSTALRLVRRLVAEDVLVRVPDEHDRRRHFLLINPRFEQPLMDYLADQYRLATGEAP